MLSDADREILSKALEMYGENTNCESDMDALYQRVLAASEEQIKQMVGRFLGWRLPTRWNPDNGISFEPIGNKGHPSAEYRRDPTGHQFFRRRTG